MSEQTVLEEAEAVVYGPRQDNYGHPAINFARIAKAWSAILDIDVTAAQVGLCMIGLKLCREANKPTRDNLVDIAGYAATLEMVAEGETPAPAPSSITYHLSRDLAKESYPDIVDGDGDTWEFHHVARGEPYYLMCHGGAIPRTEEDIHNRYPPRHPDEIVDGEGSRWELVGDGKYSWRRTGGELATGELAQKTPDWIYNNYGRRAV